MLRLISLLWIEVSCIFHSLGKQCGIMGKAHICDKLCNSGRSLTLFASFSQLCNGDNKNAKCEKFNCVDVYEVL